MKLSKRLETIAQMVPETAKDSCVADIGTDHGFVPIWLLTNGRAARALAMDVRKGPLLRAEEHIAQYGLGDRIETRLSDGLEKLQISDEVDTVVIAGMGGELMLRILRDGDHVRESVHHWVLSPQSEPGVFRHGLEELGLAIVKEIMLEEEGKYYTVMLVEPGQMHYEQEYQYLYGECLLKDKSPVLKEFLDREQRQYRQILARLHEQQSETAKMRLSEMKEELAELEKALKEFHDTDWRKHKMQERELKCKEIVEKLEALAPRSYACDWDNPGLLVGWHDKEVKKILVALDATDEVVEQAVREQVDLLLTHHPMIFKALKQINDDNFISRRVLDLVQNQISYFAMHTNFDVAPGCMADLAAARLPMTPEEPLELTGEADGQPIGIGKIGTLTAPMTVEELAKQVKEQFDLPFVMIYGADQVKEQVSRIAVSPGSGGSMISHALNKRAQVLVTGDIGHHEGIDAAANGLAIIDAGHYGLEHIFIPYMKDWLEQQLGEAVEVITAKPAFPVKVIV